MYMIPVLFGFSDWALFVLRIAVAVIFIVHGFPKLKDLKTNASNFNMMGFRPGMLWGTIVAVIEAIGGVLLLLGLMTQFIGVLLAIQMTVAALWKKKGGQKLAGGYELDLLLVAATLILATMGGGALSI